MKLVCMCRGGNVRSVAAKQILNRFFGHETIAIGLDTTSAGTKRFLFEWADYIIVMKDSFVTGVPEDFRCKVVLLDVGDDKYGTPFNEELQLKVLELVNNTPLLSGATEVTKDHVLAPIRRYATTIRKRNEGTK